MNKSILVALALVAAAAGVTYRFAAADQVTICHRPPGNKENAQTLNVARNAVPAHLNHGDQLGACPASGSR
jgi:hypothetical protein